MKALKYYLSAILLVTAFWSCTDTADFGTADFVTTAVPPTNVKALFNVTQDNTGLVTITPNGEGAVSYEISFGDNTDSVKIKQGEITSHTYAEGTYEVKIVAIGITGLKAEVTKPIEISFKSPENLTATIENDKAISKQVNVTVTADYGLTYDVYFGEPGNDTPVSGNIGETVSYVYQNAGTYTIKVVAKSAAIATTEYSEDFEVTAILQPINSAATPMARIDTDVISIFSDAYTNVAGTDYFPDWGQGGQGSSWAMFDLNGDSMLQYINLSYQGIQFGSPVNATNMETLHLDVWTANVTGIDIYPIDGNGAAEKFVHKDLVADQWNSIDIPLTDFTDQELPLDNVIQFKFVASNWAAGTAFMDNIYFYKQPSSVMTLMIEDFEGTPPTFTEFGNIAPIQVVANPDLTGNTTNKVAQLTKTAGSETWAGAFFEVSSPLDFNSYSKISMQVWSPKAGAVVKMKLENSDSSVTTEVDQVTSVANGWETLTYDFSAAPIADYVRIVAFFDFGNAGDDVVYYYDEIQLINDGGSSSGTQIDLPVDFESSTVDYTLTDFGDNSSSVIVDPTNASNMVAKVTKLITATTWAGTTIGTDTGFASNIPITLTNSKMSVKVWSPDTGTPIRLKIEDANDNTHTCETEVNTSVTGGWETLVFDFNNEASGTASLSNGLSNGWVYNKASIFFNFGTDGATAGEKTYYFDDVIFIAN